jgi:L-arabinose 1-dehydrogenase [NAD(P)+]
MAQFSCAIWLSPEGCRQGIRKAATEPLSVNLTSANDENYVSLVEARCGFGYRPQDNAANVLDLD